MSWIIFLTVNLMTQGILNLWINTSSGSIITGYGLISILIIGEFFVFIGEMILLPMFIKEHKKSYIVLYAFIANTISLIAGGYLLSLLPV